MAENRKKENKAALREAENSLCEAKKNLEALSVRGEKKCAAGKKERENGGEDIKTEAVHRMRVERARTAMPSEEMLEETCNIFKMLAEPSRLKILLTLLEGETCVLHIVEAVGGKQSAVSHQLRILKDGKAIKARRNGQNVVYSIADEHIAQMIAVGTEHARCEIE